MDTDPGLLVYLVVGSELALPYFFDMCDFVPPQLLSFTTSRGNQIRPSSLPVCAVQHQGCLPIELISKSKAKLPFSQVIFLPYRKLSFSIFLLVFFDLSA